MYRYSPGTDENFQFTETNSLNLTTDPHPSSYLVLRDIISKTLFTYLEYEHICKIGDIDKAWTSPCQKLHIFLDSVNVDVNEFEICRPYLQIEYGVLKDTDGFHIF